MDLLWGPLHDRLAVHGISNQLTFAVGMVVSYFIFYLLHCYFFFYCDKSGLLDKYAIRDAKHKLPSDRLYMKSIQEGCFDCLVIKPIFCYYAFSIFEPYISFSLDLPPAHVMIGTVLLMQASYSTTFFLMHMLFHKVPILYKYAHKQHHEFHESVGFGSMYFHPTEGALSMIHVIIPAVVFKPHFVVWILYIIVTLVEIVDAHCGYDVPWKVLYLWSDIYPWGSGARGHDYHHSHNKGMYGGGLLGIWDRVLQCDSDFKAYEHKHGRAA